MSKAKVKLNYAGVGALLRGSEMQQLVTDYAARAVTRAGEGYDFRVHNTGQRQAANVFPTTEAASQDNLENNTLLKVVK